MNIEEKHPRQSFQDLYRLIIRYDRTKHDHSLSKYVIYLQSIGIECISRSYLYKLEDGQISIPENLIHAIVANIEVIDSSQETDYQSIFYHLVDLALKLRTDELAKQLQQLPGPVRPDQFDYYYACVTLQALYFDKHEADFLTKINLIESSKLHDPYIAVGLKTLTYAHYYFQKSTRLVPVSITFIEAPLINPNNKLDSIRHAIANLNNCFYAYVNLGSHPHLQYRMLDDQIQNLLSSGYLIATISIKIMQCYSELWLYQYEHAIQTILNLREMAGEFGFSIIKSHCDDFLVVANIVGENFSLSLDELKKQDFSSLINSKRLNYLMLLYICEPDQWDTVYQNFTFTDSKDALNKAMIQFFDALNANASLSSLLNHYCTIVSKMPSSLWMECNTKFLIFLKQYALRNNYTLLAAPLEQCRINLMKGKKGDELLEPLKRIMYEIDQY